MVNSLENIDKSKVYVDRIEGLDEVVSDVISDTLTGAVSTITTSDLTAGKILVSDNNGKVVAGSDALSDLVHKSGNETITDIKTFEGTYKIIALQNSDVTYDTAPSNNKLTNLSFTDKNGVSMGVLEHVRHTNNNTCTRLVTKGIDGNWSAGLEVGKKANGNDYTSAPTPTENTTSSNQIDTVGARNTALLNKADKSIIATGSTESRLISDRFADIINVKDFGAKGDGVTDDTVAIQNAVNSGKSIYFPQGIYIVSSTITDNIRAQSRAFYGAQTNAGEHNVLSGAVIKFTNNSIGWDIQGSHIFFIGLNFTQDTRDNSFIALRYKAIANTDDIDGYVENCCFHRCGKAIECWGRTIVSRNNNFVNCETGIKLEWDTSGVEYTSWMQTPPFANRALQIIGNRWHSTGGKLIENNGDVLRSSKIEGNVLDIGGALIHDNKGLDSVIIKGNVCDFAQSWIMLLKGDIYNTLIDGNMLSGIYSRKDYSSVQNVPSGAFGIIDVEGENVNGLTITNNILQGYLRRGISFYNDVDTTKNIYNIVISNNKFESGKVGTTGYGASSIFHSSQIHGMSIIGNSITNPSDGGSVCLLFSHTGANVHELVCKDNYIGNNVLYNNQNAIINPEEIQTEYGRLYNTNEDISGSSYTFTNKSNYSMTAVFNKPDSTNQRIGFYGEDGNYVTIGVNMYPSGGGTPNIFSDSSNGEVNLGNASNLWKEIFCANATINTSDERLKQDIEDIDEAVFRAWEKVDFKQFRFKDSVNIKGENARIHFGVIAQRVKEAFESEGLDGFKYGLLCYDEWEDEFEDEEVVDKPTEYDEDGNETVPAKTHIEKKLVRAAGNAYGIRYGEALALECAYQRWKLEQVENKLNSL